ncbi:MAG TPA: acetyl-CoA carboxylase carboxyl transferase subunit alpha, partial [Rhizomicrobium sp.]
SVISPEGCASILWRRPEKNQDAAAAMRLTAQDLLGLGLIDAIVAEPMGGAHRAVEEAINNVGEQIAHGLSELSALAPDELRRQRRDKFLAMGRDLAK